MQRSVTTAKCQLFALYIYRSVDLSRRRFSWASFFFQELERLGLNSIRGEERQYGILEIFWYLAKFSFLPYCYLFIFLLCKQHGKKIIFVQKKILIGSFFLLMKINPFCRYSADKNNKNLVFEKQASTVSQSAAVFHVQASAES